MTKRRTPTKKGSSKQQATGRKASTKRTPAKQPAPVAGPEEGAFSYDGLDRVLHEKARLGILTALATQVDGLPFVELKRACTLTDGNLARHLQTLQDADLVQVEKHTPVRGRPTTFVSLTREGRQQFVAYVEELERVVRDARAATAPKRRRGRDEPDGFAPA